MTVSNAVAPKFKNFVLMVNPFCDCFLQIFGLHFRKYLLYDNQFVQKLGGFSE